ASWRGPRSGTTPAFPDVRGCVASRCSFPVGRTNCETEVTRDPHLHHRTDRLRAASGEFAIAPRQYDPRDALSAQAFLERPPELLPHGELVPFLDELHEPAFLDANEGGGRPSGLLPGRRDVPVRLARVAPLGGVSQADPVPLGEEDVEA